MRCRSSVHLKARTSVRRTTRSRSSRDHFGSDEAKLEELLASCEEELGAILEAAYQREEGRR